MTGLRRTGGIGNLIAAANRGLSFTKHLRSPGKSKGRSEVAPNIGIGTLAGIRRVRSYKFKSGGIGARPWIHPGREVPSGDTECCSAPADQSHRCSICNIGNSRIVPSDSRRNGEVSRNLPFVLDPRAELRLLHGDVDVLVVSEILPVADGGSRRRRGAVNVVLRRHIGQGTRQHIHQILRTGSCIVLQS